MSLRGDQTRRPILTLEKSSLPYGLTLTESNLYWTDWKK